MPFGQVLLCNTIEELLAVLIIRKIRVIRGQKQLRSNRPQGQNQLPIINDQLSV
jgi:hypothetical protein